MTTRLDDRINTWADDGNSAVALHLRQQLMPVEGVGGVIFPPTYKGIDYNVDVLADGTKIATIDSVGAQANRMEPLFMPARMGEPENPRAALVPQIDIAYGNEKSVSILEVGHRLADAVVRSTALFKDVKHAFQDYKDRGDATALAKIGPTSLLFGVWDSRGTQVKFPRIVQSTIRAEDVDELRRSAQYVPPVDYSALDIFSDADKRSTDNPKSPLARGGFAHVPAVGTHGGVIARGPIRRDVTVNLVALRRLTGNGSNDTALRRYILGLALVSATAPLDGFLRAGCLLTLDPEHQSVWEEISRKGERAQVPLETESVLGYAKHAASAFGVGKDRRVSFDKALAKEAVAEAKKKPKGN